MNSTTLFNYDNFLLKEKEEILVQNKETGNIYPVQNFNSEKHIRPSKKEIEKNQDKEEELDSKDPEFKKLSNISVKKDKSKLNDIKEILKDADEDTQKRGEVLSQNWNKFLDAKTEEERIEAIQTLADNNLIEAHSGGKKIYLTSNTALPYKYLTGASGGSNTVLMNDIIKKHGLNVPLRSGGRDKELADMSGKHNESGVVAYLHDSEENLKNYKGRQDSLKELGGDEVRFDKINKEAAEKIKSVLPKGSTILDSKQVGGAGETALKEMGIDPKVDPTDLIVKYKDAEGKEQLLKVSAKTYSDPRNITMKNSGVKTAGETYLGEAGKNIDKEYEELRQKYKWDDTMTREEKDTKKRELKKAYLTKYSDAMTELTKTDKGQAQLEKMWQEVHGCGKDVYTQVINKTTGEVQLHKPDHYCKPAKPFTTKYDGVKMVVNMEGKTDEYLEIVMKTEDQGSPKLLFNHIKKDKKK
jgi:hypothetical protein